MKAIVQNEYGSPDVLELKEIDRPVVKDGEVLVRVNAAAVNPGDCHIMRGLPYVARLSFGLLKPKDRVRGQDVAGLVAAVGKDVKRLQPGDEVFGWCKGAFAEYASAAENNLAPKPDNLTLEQAAAVPLAGVTALQALRDIGKVQPGQRVLINGATGGVGTFAVQIAKSFGAEVTGVCSSRNVEMVRLLGADHVIDYTRDDFTQSRERYDLVLDNVANRSLSVCRRALASDAILISNGGASGGRWIGPAGRVIEVNVWSPFVREKLRTFLTKWSNEDLIVLNELIESGKITPVIDTTFPLSEAAEAIRYLEAGHAQGKIVITV